MLSVIVPPPSPTLPSTSSVCLEVLLYLRCIGVDHSVEHTHYSEAVLNRLPCVKWGAQVVGGSQCIAYLQKEFCNLDQDLPESLWADTNSYRFLVEKCLLPLTDHVRWRVNKNYSHSRRTIISCPFPLNHYTAYLQYHRADTYANSAGLGTLEQVEEEARGCYLMLSTRLGKHKYFSNTDRPCSLDILVAATVAAQYHIDTPLDPFHNMLSNDFGNLVSHFQGLLHELYPTYKITCQIKSDLLVAPAPAPVVHTPTPPTVHDVHKQLTAEKKTSKETVLTEKELESRKNFKNWVFALSVSTVLIGSVAHFRRRAAEGK